MNFATYLATQHKANVAVINLAGNGDYAKLAAAERLSDGKGDGVNSFVKHFGKRASVSFFQEKDYDNLMRNQIEKYDFVIYDMATRFIKNEKLFMSTDQRVIIGSNLPWRECEFEQFLSFARKNTYYREWEYVLMLSGSAKAAFIDGGRIKLKRMGVISDAFVVSEDVARMYRSLL